MAIREAQHLAMSFAAAERELEIAWRNPNHTPIELPPVDVNRILQDYYVLSHPLTFTRAMMWDVEVRKARDPLRYIPAVVQEGTIWDRTFLPNGDEFFLRASRQRLWLTGEVGTILEETHLSHDRQSVIFFGRVQFRTETGERIHRDERQPLFHVEHAVGGTESRPLSLWRIVHLTDGQDQRLHERFARLNDPHSVPEFVEVYIQRDLEIELARREPGPPPDTDSTRE